eukprot:7102753-Pyramimonas_sp.AAC.1
MNTPAVRQDGLRGPKTAQGICMPSVMRRGQSMKPRSKRRTEAGDEDDKRQGGGKEEEEQKHLQNIGTTTIIIMIIRI